MKKEKRKEKPNAVLRHKVLPEPLPRAQHIFSQTELKALSEELYSGQGNTIQLDKGVVRKLNDLFVENEQEPFDFWEVLEKGPYKGKRIFEVIFPQSSLFPNHIKRILLSVLHDFDKILTTSSAAIRSSSFLIIAAQILQFCTEKEMTDISQRQEVAEMLTLFFDKISQLDLAQLELNRPLTIGDFEGMTLFWCIAAAAFRAPTTGKMIIEAILAQKRISDLDFNAKWKDYPSLTVLRLFVEHLSTPKEKFGFSTPHMVKKILEEAAVGQLDFKAATPSSTQEISFMRSFGKMMGSFRDFGPINILAAKYSLTYEDLKEIYLGIQEVKMESEADEAAQKLMLNQLNFALLFSTYFTTCVLDQNPSCSSEKPLKPLFDALTFLNLADKQKLQNFLATPLGFEVIKSLLEWKTCFGERAFNQARAQDKHEWATLLISVTFACQQNDISVFKLITQMIGACEAAICDFSKEDELVAKVSRSLLTNWREVALDEGENDDETAVKENDGKKTEAKKIAGLGCRIS